MCDTDVVIESSCQHCGIAISIETAQRGTKLTNVRPDVTVVWYDLAYDCCAATSCVSAVLAPHCGWRDGLRGLAL
jgi:hypothetical protein